MTAKEREPFAFLGKHLAAGIIAGIVFGILVLATDLSHIRTMLMDSPNAASTLALMFFGLIITFGSVAMAVGIMSLARDAEDGGGRD